VSAALQVASSDFDRDYYALAPHVRDRIDRKIDEMGLRLRDFPHHRLKGSNRYRLRVGDYRVIYSFDPEKGVIHLLALGHRREIYR
jgi:mRNA interferase RelE/StbE